MAQMHGRAGDVTYRAGDRLMIRALVPMLLMGVLTYLLFYLGTAIDHTLWLCIGSAVIGLGFWCLSGIFRLESFADRYYVGAGGEYDVGTLLSQLPPEFHVFNGVGFYGGDIDHIVIGPTGIFVVETKSHGGTIAVRQGRVYRNGAPLERDYLRQVKLESRYVKGRLGADPLCVVQPVLVFARANVRSPRLVHGVQICALKSLPLLITEPAPFLSAERVEQLSALFEGTDVGGTDHRRSKFAMMWTSTSRIRLGSSARSGLLWLAGRNGSNHQVLNHRKRLADQ